MKKFLAIAVIAATFTACNDEKKAEETTVTKDTTMAVVKDTTAVVTKDTVPVVTTTTVDTLAKKMEEKK
jgi:hypothetical protein